jgi:hypothetical protein
MGVKYLSDSYPFTEVHKAIIEKWIQDAIDKKSWEEDIDLHLDEICRAGKYNSRGKHKKYWIPLSISLVYYANQFLQKITSADIIGVVVMPLYANEKSKMGFNFRKLEDIRAAFDVTPPLLYLTSVESKVAIHEYRISEKKEVFSFMIASLTYLRMKKFGPKIASIT